MLGGQGRIPVFAYHRPAELRKGFEGLSGLVREALGLDPLSGALYLFTNRRRTTAKVLHFDGTGLGLYIKRLARGTQVAAIFYTLIETCILCGVDPDEYMRFTARAALLKPGTAILPQEFAREPTLGRLSGQLFPPLLGLAHEYVDAEPPAPTRRMQGHDSARLDRHFRNPRDVDVLQHPARMSAS